MENYVKQLVADIEALLKEKAPHELHQSPDDFIEQLEEAEDHFLNEKGALVSEFSGISTEQLPAVELLSEEELELLLNNLTNLLEYYHFYLEFPGEVPTAEKYKTLREEWVTYKTPLAAGNYHHDFCSGDPGDCQFSEYCNNCTEDSETRTCPRRKTFSIYHPNARHNNR